MAILPARLNLGMERDADYSVSLVFEDGDGNSMNLNGWTVFAKARNLAKTIEYADFLVEYVDRTKGAVKISLTAEQIAVFPSELIYQVFLVNPSGLRSCYLHVNCYVF